jgi:hypothetical protein
MKELISQDVVDLHAHLCQKFNATLVDQQSKEALLAFEQWLIRRGITSVKAYMGKYATTLGNLIYLPYTPGVATDDWPLVWQCATAAHETYHVEQFRKEPANYSMDYVADSGSRAYYEAECYRASSEVNYFLTGNVLDPTYLDCLHAYLCGAEDIAFAKLILSDAEPTIRAGGIYTPTAKETRVFLRQRGYGK